MRMGKKPNTPINGLRRPQSERDEESRRAFRAAIESYNRFIEKNGVFGEEFQDWDILRSDFSYAKSLAVADLESENGQRQDQRDPVGCYQRNIVLQQPVDQPQRNPD